MIVQNNIIWLDWAPWLELKKDDVWAKMTPLFRLGD